MPTSTNIPVKKIFLGVFLYCLPTALFAQADSMSGISKMRFLIKEKKIEAANAYLDSQIQHFRKNNQPDSLKKYIEFVGSYSLNNQNWDRVLQGAQKLADELLALKDPSISKYVYRELAWVQSDAGRPDLAYTSIEKALKEAQSDSSGKEPTIEDIYYNMGYYAAETSNYVLAKKNYLKSLKINKTKSDPDYVSLQQVNNALGGIMWREGKMDSCNYYFNESLKALAKTDSTPNNQYYRPALVYMNMAVVSNVLGNNHEAVSYSQFAIENFEKFIQISPDEQKANAARTSQLAAIDNLGVFYNAVGEFSKAEELIAYAYAQKLKTKSKDDPNILISKIILAQAKLNTRDLEGANKLLLDAAKISEEKPILENFWTSAIYTTHAQVLEQLNRTEEAAAAYKKGLKIIEETVLENHNNETLSDMCNAAVFYAKNGYRDQALQLADKIYKTVQKSQFKDTQQGYSFNLAVAETYFQLKDYVRANLYSQEVVQAINNQENDTIKTVNAVLNSFQLPRALLVQAKSEYQLTPSPDISLLKSLLSKVESGFETLQLRQTLLQNYDDVSLLVSQNQELINFAKQLSTVLYQKTMDERYLDKLVQLHESSIYNRIRARLNLRNLQQFANVPRHIIKQEDAIKTLLSKSLKDTSEKGIASFLEASEQWDAFRNKLKKKYPDYFNLKYASVLQENTNWKQNLPKKSTVVRYIFIEDDLYALTFQNKESKLYKLDSQNVQKDIVELQEALFDVEDHSKVLRSLYQKLWAPIAKDVTTENIIILPDGPLYTLSFETLLQNPISSFEEMSQHSLLAKHNISYHFSLFLLKQHPREAPTKDFVAFAPSFDQDMKTEYVATITDSLAMDKSYLTLLPQPFIKEVVTKYSRLFKGDAYLNKEASKSVFLEKANEHKIIHIGTHAENDNLSPELSRLIFAKELTNNSTEDNILYAYEIYNYNLNSDLAILTACETGKPTYQPGEGMISLTHAFTYAGSNSLLTSLWQVDEKSSATIVSLFYDRLAEGMPKNEALRHAKLDYLDTGNGRELAPQYWAGLVLMGETNAIVIETQNYIWWWVGAGILLVVVIYFFFRRKKARHA